MPLAVENKLKARASKKGLKGKRWKAYVYGTMNKLKMLEANAEHPTPNAQHRILRGLVELAQKINLGEKWTTGECYPHPVGQKNDPVRYPTMYISGRKERIDIPDKGKAVVDYRVRSRSMNKNDDEDERHSIDIEVQSIEPQDVEEDKPKEGEAARLMLHDLRVLTGFADPRPRNSLGEYAPQEEGAPDPNAMAAAYGPPAVQPVSPMTESHVERIKRFFGKRRETAEQAD